MISDNSPEPPSSDGVFEQASRNTLALNPLVGMRGKDLLDSAAVLVKAMINEPKVAADEWVSFLALPWQIFERRLIFRIPSERFA